MKRILTLLLLFSSLVSLAQVVITGKVTGFTDQKPVASVSVFLSNATIGTTTHADGTFTLNNVKSGQYDLVVSIVGYETHHQTITVGNTDISIPAIQIFVKNNVLNEVKIDPPDPNRNINFEIFKEEFLGRTENAAQCKITNPDVINIKYYARDRTLNASSDEFIIIDNKALGYRIHYQLAKFVKDYAGNMVYYEGSVLFEEMKGKPAEHRKWEKKRLETYNGSSMHFLRSVIKNEVTENGFKVFRLIRKPNTARPTDSLIRSRLRKFGLVNARHPEYRDSVNYWSQQLKLPKILQYLVSQPLNINDFTKRTDNPNLFALALADFPYIVYTKKREPNSNSGVFHPLDVPDYPVTIITITQPYAVFDRNGIFSDPASTIFEGAWGISAVADLLPVDYEPPVKM